MQWIEELRKEVSELYGCLIAIRLVLRREGRAGRPNELLSEANRHFANIRLRLNKDDDKYRELCGTLDEIEHLYGAEGDPDYGRMESVNTNLLTQTRTLLKIEWQKVQVGEPVFRHAKFALIAALIIAFVYLGKLAFGDSAGG